MTDILQKLPNLSEFLIKSLEMTLVSLYKIDKTHHIFKELLQNEPSLANAEYIVYPNINGSEKKFFLDKTGVTLLSYDKGVSEFILLPSEIESDEWSSISIDNPYANSMTSFKRDYSPL